MNKASLTVLVSLSMLAGAAYAQENGITVSTDPAKAADVEQRAQALQEQQEMHPQPAAPKHRHHHKAMKQEGGAMQGDSQ
jgi:hypothetical protein